MPEKVVLRYFFFTFSVFECETKPLNEQYPSPNPPCELLKILDAENGNVNSKKHEFSVPQIKSEMLYGSHDSKLFFFIILYLVSGSLGFRE
ncbi:hypothetical protein AYI68_g5488 [Smittium mucronatum]|uniref:Uncharacterized protein n=1 Tax=Smittium mucronatum TaxID=133383 RepID=A0A1R0GU40_9FUNG|nr:hypothetical protein AYI68_g5488 [Smittium mucronatum]